MGLVTDHSWSGAARELPPAHAAAPGEAAPVGRYELLTDQLGMEDQLGDMDLKVAGGCPHASLAAAPCAAQQLAVVCRGAEGR